MNSWQALTADKRAILTRHGVLLTVGVSALAGVFPIANYGVLHKPEPHVFAALALLSVALMAVSFVLQRRSETAIVSLLEAELRALRVDLAGRLAASPLRIVETHAAIQTKLVGDLEELDKAVQSAVDTVHDAVLLAFLGVYVLVVSPGGFLIWCGVCFGLGILLAPDFLDSRRAFVAYVKVRDRLYEEIDRTLRAFPQLQLDRRARESVRARLKELIASSSRQRAEASIGMREVGIRASTFLYLGLATMLFSAPRQLGLDVETTYVLVTLLFLTMVPANRLVRSVDLFLAARVSWTEVSALRELLSAPEPDGPVVEPRPFQSLSFKGVRFAYGPPEAPGFAVGPIDLEIERGELVFLTGANGSGKTTFMKVIAGLYAPSSGTRNLDGQCIGPADEESWRSLFSTIFTDQHLFPKPYGLEDRAAEHVEELLERFALSKVTGLNKQGRFTSLQLSSGQKKRLSMVVALLEDRPIYLLDEWAAHQDPQLRLYYYETLLPELKAQGRTVIAVSHDDRFFHVADRVVHLVNGRLSDTPEAWLSDLNQTPR